MNARDDKQYDSVGDSGTKPLSPAIKGCLGCGVFVVIITAALAYGARVGLEKAAEEGIFFTEPRPVLRRTPGGVIRNLQIKPESRTAFTLGVGWINRHQVAYTVIGLPQWSDMMAFGQRGMGLGFWDQEKREEYARNMVSEMFDQRMQYYDLRQRRGGVLTESSAGIFFSFGPTPWGPDGRHALVEGRSLDWSEDGEDNGGAVVYLFDRRERSWTRLADGYQPMWCGSGRWVLFQREGEGGKAELWRISPDGGDETLLHTGTFDVADRPRGQQLSEYLYIWDHSEDDPPLLRLDLSSGDTAEVPIECVGVQAGAMSPTEIIHRDIETRVGGDDERVRRVGALDLETGRYRIIRDDFPTGHTAAMVILDGRAMLVRYREGPPPGPDDEFSMDAQPWRVLSCEDGKLRAGPGRWTAETTSPDGTRVAGAVQSEHMYMGMIPMPTQTIAIWEITNPDQILTGPEEDIEDATDPGGSSSE